MKAAEAGDPQGWLVLGFEYDTGKLGGDPPYWHQMAMEAYRKAADGGNCLAMMAIGDLYAAGNGVRADQAQAQSWHTKAQSCQGGNIAMLQQQVAQYNYDAAALSEWAACVNGQAWKEAYVFFKHDEDENGGSGPPAVASFVTACGSS